MNNFESVNELVLKYELNPGDIVVARARIFGLFNHYLAYYGDINGEKIFIGNFRNGGVKIINSSQVALLLQKYRPTSILRYYGSENAQIRIKKRYQELKTKHYNYLNNNCMHFVQRMLREEEEQKPTTVLKN